MKKNTGSKAIREPSLADALIPLIVLTLMISSSLALFGMDALDGPIQTALIICCVVAGLIAVKNGHSWEAVQRAGRGAMESITSAIFILLAVGALIGTWNLAGTIPTLVYYGIQVLSPAWYYPAAALICGAIAISIGSSWTTAGTIGVGLVGIAAMIGVSPAIAAGAVVSGAYLGELLSALFAGALGAFLQPGVYAEFAGADSLDPADAVAAVWQAMANGFEMNSGIADVDRLLSRGGMSSMLHTLWLIMGAVTFGALLDEFGLIGRLVDPLIYRAKSTGGLFLTVFASAFGLNLVAGDQS